MEKPSVNRKMLNETQINSSQVANITWMYSISIVHNNCVWDSRIHNLDKSPSTVNWTIKVIRYSTNSDFQMKMISHVEWNVYNDFTNVLFETRNHSTRKFQIQFNEFLFENHMRNGNSNLLLKKMQSVRVPSSVCTELCSEENLRCWMLMNRIYFGWIYWKHARTPYFNIRCSNLNSIYSIAHFLISMKWMYLSFSATELRNWNRLFLLYIQTSSFQQKVLCSIANREDVIKPNMKLKLYINDHCSSKQSQKCKIWTSRRKSKPKLNNNIKIANKNSQTFSKESFVQPL